MNDPGYDFFAIGGPDDPAKVPPPEGQPPIVPSPVPPVVGATYHSPPPARTFQMGTMTVNQFGTPVELPAVPTGPYAAPGMGTAPAPVPGLVTTWQGPQPTGRTQQAGHRTVTTPRDDLPANVRAVALLGIVLGLLYAFIWWNAFSLYSDLKNLVDASGSGSALGSQLTQAYLSGYFVGLLILAFCSAFLLLGGGATFARQRWGGWMLVVALGISLPSRLWAIHQDGITLFSGLGLALVVVLLFAMLTGDGRRWLMNES